jgi:hypothetical protein
MVSISDVAHQAFYAYHDNFFHRKSFTWCDLDLCNECDELWGDVHNASKQD